MLQDLLSVSYDMLPTGQGGGANRQKGRRGLPAYPCADLSRSQIKNTFPKEGTF
ncbi:MAG TPA: hypothetical protein OIL76_02500 [Veillonellaceae bacterium]|nr:hypothetical protein [Veillonellaceae bacterium]